MPTLLEALMSEGSPDTHTPNQSGFVEKLAAYASVISTNMIKYAEPLNLGIAKIAKANNLNDDQIQRVVEECNNRVFLIKYAHLKNEDDRRVSFDIASLQGVKDAMNGNNELEKVASVKVDDFGFDVKSYGGSFTSDLCGYNETKLKDVVMEKVASDLSQSKQMSSKLSTDLDEHVYTIADAISHAEVQYGTGQRLFNEMTKQAELNLDYQEMLCGAINEKVASAISEGLWCGDPNFKVYQCVTTDSRFTLGKHSFIEKFAGLDPLNQSIKCSHHIIDGVGELVKLAHTVKKLADKITEVKVSESKLYELLDRCSEVK